MKWSNRTLTELVAIAAMTVVVLVLAVLQYQWTGEIGRNEQDRLKSSLNDSVTNFNQEFSYDFERLCEAFWINPEMPTTAVESQLVQLRTQWLQTSSKPGLLGGLYIWNTAAADSPSLESLNPATQRFQQAAWPAGLDSVRRWLSRPARQQIVIGDREAMYYPWTLVEDSAALVRPLFKMSSNPGDAGDSARPVGFLIVELNKDYLAQQYFPDLVDRDFGSEGQRSFGVAIRSVQAPYQAVYASDAALRDSDTSPDATADLFKSVSEEARRRGRPPLLASGVGRQWQLLVQHPAGSLESAVTSWRRRSLLISFTLLAFLTASVALIFSVARRAEHLAKLQMDFVTSVSHELCTPLAVIHSAAENLVDGVVDEPNQIQEYGGLIREQSQRLENLVDEVLQFAAERSGRSSYDMRPVKISNILTQRLDASEGLLRDAGFTLQKEIVANLPVVVADPAAFGKCLDNLLSNAMKYSNGSRWIGVRAQVANHSSSEVQVSVQDHGVGIAAADLPHVFEPFYRVQSAREGSTRGMGLGLYLVKSMMESMGGRVSVTSEPGQGSFFTLHLPITLQAEEQHEDTA